MSLITLEPNIDRPDDLYAAVVEMTAGVSDAHALARQARLILLMANQIGEVAVITQLVQMAMQLEDGGEEPTDGGVSCVAPLRG